MEALGRGGRWALGWGGCRLLAEVGNLLVVVALVIVVVLAVVTVAVLLVHLEAVERSEF